MSLYKGLGKDCLYNELETAVFIKGCDENDYAAELGRRVALVTPMGRRGFKRMRGQVLTISEILTATYYLQGYSKGKIYSGHPHTIMQSGFSFIERADGFIIRYSHVLWPYSWRAEAEGGRSMR